MEGYLNLRIAPWLRRLVTRMIALIPAVVVISLTGEGSTQQLLVLSQVILSLQLSFAVIPLIHFTSNRLNMGEFATPWWGKILAWLTASIIVALNGKLVFDQIGEWVALAADSGAMVGPLPASWAVGASLYGLAAAVLALLAWVTLKPLALALARLGPQAERRARLGRRPAASPAGDDRRGPGARPGRRRDPQPRLEPGPCPERRTWSCSTSSTRR